MATPSLKDDAAHSIKKATGNTSAIDVSEGQVLNKVLTNTEIDPAHLEALRNYVPGTDLEKRLLRKLDLRLVPTLWLMCVLCFMDRSNIGNANAAGMGEDLSMTDAQYSMLITVFFIAYFVWEVPSNLILARCPRPSWYLPGLMLVSNTPTTPVLCPILTSSPAWGALVVVMSEMRTYPHAVVCRIFLALIEAGFPPGVLYIMTTWYKRSEIGKRWSLFYTAICFSGAASGLISGAVMSGLDGALGRPGWRWLFVIEGVVTMAFALCAPFILPDYPHTPSRRFSEEERALAVARMMHDRAEADAPKRKLSAAQSVLAAVSDGRLYLFILVFILQNGSATVSYFIPTVLGSMGYSGVAQQWMTVPVWATGVVVIIIFAFISDRVGNRHWFVVGALTTSLISAIVCNFVRVDVVRYVFLCFYIAGLYTTYPLVLNWASETMSKPAEKRAVVIAFVNAGGSLSSAYGGYIWPSSDAPDYKTGFTTVSCFIGIGLLIAIVLPFLAKFVPQNSTKAERELE